MPPDTPALLAAILLLIAFIVAARTFMAWHAIDTMSDEVLRRGVALEDGRDKLRASATEFRGKLNAANATIERGLWGVAHFDQRATALEGQLRSRRADIDEFHVRYVARADQGLRQLRRTARLLKQLNELRRTFLG